MPMHHVVVRWIAWRWAIGPGQERLSPAGRPSPTPAPGVARSGRRCGEAMTAHGRPAAQPPGATRGATEFASRWRDMPKVVFSSTTSPVDWNTRLVTGDAVTEITRLKADDGGPMDIGGATLAAAAMRAGLIDEYAIAPPPVPVGGGTPLFTAPDHSV